MLRLHFFKGWINLRYYIIMIICVYGEISVFLWVKMSFYAKNYK